jgi:dTDP-4-amino-4,6-dideoxygalactose transaminase
MDLARQHGPLAADLRAAFERVLGSSGFILGEEVERFEHEFAGYCGARHCVGVASGTAALTIMIQAAGIGRGDEVIVPAQTFIASALAVIHAGARPVYVDVERGSGLLDPTAVEAAVGPATTAILAVHLYGQACAMDPLRELADRRGLLLLEDAAQAHGATYRGIRAGNLGRAAAFSFYPSKSLGALGDGGAITTNDADLARRARALRDLGRGDSSIHTVAGYNERLDGLQAALLRAKLPHVDAWNAARREAARRYRARLEDIELLEESPASPCIYHLFPVRVADRDALAAELGTAGIATGVHYPSSVPDQPAMRDGLSGSFPVAAEWAATELSLPIFPGITEDELTFVSSRVNYWTTGRAHHDGRAGDDLLNTAEPARAGWGSGGGWS